MTFHSVCFNCEFIERMGSEGKRADRLPLDVGK